MSLGRNTVGYPARPRPRAMSGTDLGFFARQQAALPPGSGWTPQWQADTMAMYENEYAPAEREQMLARLRQSGAEEQAAPLALERGDDSDLSGAPETMLPGYAEAVDAIAARLKEEDEAGPNIYMGHMPSIRARAQELLDRRIASNRARLDAAQQRGSEVAAQREQQLAARRGIDPDAVLAERPLSASETRLANMPQDTMSQLVEQEADLSADATRGLREGRRNWGAEQNLQYAQGPGFQDPSDLATLQDIQARQGFMRLEDGSMVPMGPAPTPEDVESQRDFTDWANQTPGSQRQAQYDPAGYASYKDQIDAERRANNQADREKYGEGSDNLIHQRAAAGNVDAINQFMNREQRYQSEQRVRNAQRGRFYEERLRAEAGLPAPTVGPNSTIDDLERAAYRRRYDARQADLDARRRRVALQAQLAGGQPTAATRAAVSAVQAGWDRTDELLARLGGANLSDWERAGIMAQVAPTSETANPTPLARDAAGLQNAMRMAQGENFAGLDPTSQAIRRQQLAVQEAALPPEQKVVLSRSRQEPMGTGLSAGPVNTAWNNSYSERGFREKMENWGYSPAEIDAWVDARRNGDEPRPRGGPPAPGSQPPPEVPGGPMYWPQPE